MRGAAIRSSVTRSAHEHATAAGIDSDLDRGRQLSAGVAACGARACGARACSADAGVLLWRSTATAATRCRSVEPTRARADSSAGCDECTAAEHRAFADSGNCIADLWPGGAAVRADGRAGARGDACACAGCRFAAGDDHRSKARCAGAGRGSRIERCGDPAGSVATREGACAFRGLDAAGDSASGSPTGDAGSGSRRAAFGGVAFGGRSAPAYARARRGGGDVTRNGDGTEPGTTSSACDGFSVLDRDGIHGTPAGARTGSYGRVCARGRTHARRCVCACGRSRVREGVSGRGCASDARGCGTACTGDVCRTGDRIVAPAHADIRVAGRACDTGAGTRADPGTRRRRRTSNFATPNTRSHGRRTRESSSSRECLDTGRSNPERASARGDADTGRAAGSRARRTPDSGHDPACFDAAASARASIFVSAPARSLVADRHDSAGTTRRSIDDACSIDSRARRAGRRRARRWSGHGSPADDKADAE
jgi:hypothetical protein